MHLRESTPGRSEQPGAAPFRLYTTWDRAPHDMTLRRTNGLIQQITLPTKEPGFVAGCQLLRTGHSPRRALNVDVCDMYETYLRALLKACGRDWGRLQVSLRPRATNCSL